MAYSYKSVSKEFTSQLLEKGSRFIAFLFPVKTEIEFKQKLKAFKSIYPDAVHHCYAYRFQNNLEKKSDDGEPSGTAGNPILSQLKSFELFDCGIIVIRYFGGVKLGTGGLIKAYKTVSKEVISKAELISIEKSEIYDLCVPFSLSGKVIALIRKYQCEILSKIGETELKLVIQIPISLNEKFINETGNLGEIKITRRPQ